MISDFRKYDGTDCLEFDLCLVGAGAAGIALAREFLASDIRVLLLESGGARPEQESDNLNAGENVGLRHDGLENGRSRILGGATRLWAGQCIPFEPIDFEERSWIPDSGWPINFDDLAPFYTRAENLFRITGEVYDARIWDKFRLRPLLLDNRNAEMKSTIYTPIPDLGIAYRDDLQKSNNVEVMLHASVTEIHTNEHKSAFSHLTISTLEGKKCRVKARACVVCSGGIENARILLLSNGLGNDNDMVGRYFQEHPNGLGADVCTDDPRRLQDLFGLLYKGGLRYFPKLQLGRDIQEEQQTLNCTSSVEFELEGDTGVDAAKRLYRSIRKREIPATLGQDCQLMVKDLANIVDMTRRRYRQGLSPAPRPKRIRLRTYAEQAPNRASRVSLSDRRDKLGLQMARVDWRLTDLDRHTMRVMAQTIAREFERLNLARVNLDPWLAADLPDWTEYVNDAYHHIGTTRMSNDPKSGVVDADCAVHGVAGLYMAGSSVFPTSGYANPTLTIVALAIRLADHLKTHGLRDRTLSMKSSPALVGGS